MNMKVQDIFLMVTAPDDSIIYVYEQGPEYTTWLDLGHYFWTRNYEGENQTRCTEVEWMSAAGEKIWTSMFREVHIDTNIAIIVQTTAKNLRNLLADTDLDQ